MSGCRVCHGVNWLYLSFVPGWLVIVMNWVRWQFHKRTCEHQWEEAYHV